MKTKMLAFALVGLMTGSLFTACNSPEKKVENAAEEVMEAQKDLDKAEVAFLKEWEEFKAEYETRIQDNENEIMRYREMEKENKDYKTKYKARIDELEVKNSVLRARINNYDAEKRQDNWESFKTEFKHDMDELGTALKDFARDNKK